MAPLSRTILPLQPSVEEAERRNTIRYQLTVAADVIEVKSGTRFSTRTTDLGPGGCFVDTLMPLPVGSSVNVRLHKDNMAFETAGTVTFSQAGLGMGIRFEEVPPEKQAAFNAWISELTTIRPGSFETHRAAPHVSSSAKPVKPSVLTQRLITLLVKRGVITQAEANALDDEPLL
ncbi:MAG TPA: PilZ domain-containing protein [Candidatus Acidoferrales bacterium]|nr:PilZ domain-containing protein [Candidatus Acidoferrales bacterium]